MGRGSRQRFEDQRAVRDAARIERLRALHARFGGADTATHGAPTRAELRAWQRSWRRLRPRRLQRQLFLAFGMAIFAAMVTAMFVFSLVHDAAMHKPWLRLIALLSAGCVLWTFAGVLAKKLAWPLLELARAAKELGAGALDRRVRLMPHAPSEITELCIAFNDMAARIEAQVRAQRELMGAVSHELRTPLARQRVLLAMLQDAGDQPDLATKFEREVVEMDALVGELLADSRISAGALTKRPLDLRDVVHECVERLGLDQVTIEIAEHCHSLSADPTLLSRALTILLDNARKHGGDRICVRASASDAGIRIAVEDDGPGFDPKDFERLFEPFARGRGAAADEQRGVGLGLYLVRRIAEAHAGRSFAENRAGGGAVVGITLARA